MAATVLLKRIQIYGNIFRFPNNLEINYSSGMPNDLDPYLNSRRGSPVACPLPKAIPPIPEGDSPKSPKVIPPSQHNTASHQITRTGTPPASPYGYEFFKMRGMGTPPASPYGYEFF